jgi:hypothetical protein
MTSAVTAECHPLPSRFWRALAGAGGLRPLSPADYALVGMWPWLLMLSAGGEWYGLVA